MTERNKYNSSKIYKICSNLTDKIYIGSTTQTLAKRLYTHVKDYKQYIRTNIKHITSYEIIKLEDYYITLIEEHNFNNRQQLLNREGEIMKLNINNIVNNRIAGEYQRDKVEYKKQYRVDNKEYLIEKRKENYNDNKEQILEKMNQTIVCECRIIYTYGNKSQHMKSTKHINLINQLYLDELTYYN